MKTKLIDINCDLGEGAGNDEQLMPFISSCNIACGGHAGNYESVQSTMLLAKQNGVKIGAHPSYPDRVNFGRISIKIDEVTFIKSITDQLNVFVSVQQSIGIPFNHIKAHGALYNDMARDEVVASWFLKAIEPYKKLITFYVPYNSVLEKMALQKGFSITIEAFADRNYNNDLSLVSRTHKNALIKDPEKVLEHILYIINDKKVKTIEGDFVKLEASTYCIHGDTDDALPILKYLANLLPKQNIQLAK